MGRGSSYTSIHNHLHDIAMLVAWLRPLAYRHKQLCVHGKGPGDARTKNKKIKYLAIERQIEKWDGNPFK